MNLPKRTQVKPPRKTKSVTLTHPEKVLYPQDAITKEDLAEYYQKVASVMLPYAIGRPLSLVRCPAGIESSCFFQKHPGQSIPDLQTITIRERSSTDQYGIITDESDLFRLVQANVLEIHSWQCMANSLETPDQVVFDLDPDTSLHWRNTSDSAMMLRDFLKELKLQSFPKLTGGKGIHVVVPIKTAYSWEQVKDFAKTIADTLVKEYPKRFIAVSTKSKRAGKIFIDYLRNDRGATAIVNYSTRARPGAPVALPVSWKEISNGMLRAPLTIKTAPKYILANKAKAWREFHSLRQPLPL